MAELLVDIDGIEVWHGDCLEPGVSEDILRGRRVDLLHTDAPYSAKTHDGHRAGKLTADRAATFGETQSYGEQNKRAIRRYASKRPERADIEYGAWSEFDVWNFCCQWLPNVDGWATTITDHLLMGKWATEFESSGRYAFCPLPWVEIGSRVRMAGDGPSNWSCWAVVARPKCEPWSKWGTLRGAYIGPAENHQNRPERVTGGKSVALTIQFLADYSRPGQLVLDPCLGGGTTAEAARMSGRRCIGIEKNRERAELCARMVEQRREQTRLFDKPELGWM